MTYSQYLGKKYVHLIVKGAHIPSSLQGFHPSEFQPLKDHVKSFLNFA